MSESLLVTLFDDQLAQLRRQALNAARRNKPTMWAYYEDMTRALRFIGTEDQLVTWLTGWSERALRDAPQIGDPYTAARLWAIGVYARRILRAAGYQVPRPRLDWLRERAA